LSFHAISFDARRLALSDHRLRLKVRRACPFALLSHYENNNELSSHPTSFVAAYNFAKRLKTLKGPTSYEFICKARTNQPERFGLNPLHEMPRLNTLSLLKKRLSCKVALTAFRCFAGVSFFAFTAGDPFVHQRKAP
jgi:hypothetical protein